MRVQRGQSVWTAEYANGKVVGMDYEAHEVYVHFYNTKSVEVIELDNFSKENFNDNLNQWIIQS